MKPEHARPSIPPLLTLISASLVFTLLAGCGAPDRPPELIIGAAASLSPALDQIGPAFTLESGVEVLFSIASTGHLAQQLRNGAPFEILASADAEHIDRLISEGWLEGATRKVFAHGRLVLAVRPGFPVSTLAALGDQDVRRLAIANPSHAPYGLAAQQALESAGLWQALQAKLVYAESVQQAAQLVASGAAQAGLVSASNAMESGLEFFELQGGLYEPIQHLAAVRTESRMYNQAMLFLDFLSSPAAKEILRAHGLEAAAE